DPGQSSGGDHAGREHPHGGRLAGAVRPEKPEDLARVYRELETVDGADARVVRLRQGLGPDHGVGIGHPPTLGAARAYALGRWLSRRTSTAHDLARAGFGRGSPGTSRGLR